MQKADFLDSPTGRLVPTEHGQWAFVPLDLPPATLDLGRLAPSLARASQLLGELNGIGRTLPDPYLLIRPLQVREALTSSSMEGTFTTVDDLLLLEAGASEQNRAADTREVRNYRRALSDAVESLAELPLCLRTLTTAHETLLRGVARHRGSRVRPGEFKQHQNFIGGGAIEHARFVPPPPREALDALHRLEAYLQRHSRADLPDLIDAALVHYQFEAIHPFADGNGRVGRMLITLQLFERSAVRQPLLYISPILEQQKDRYIDLIYEVSRHGRWHEWLSFFLDVVSESCEATISTADALLNLQRDYRRRLTQAGRSANLHIILDMLFRTPVVTIPTIAEALRVTYRSAQLNVEALVSVGVLEDVAETANPKYFVARGIRDIIDQTPGRHA